MHKNMDIVSPSSSKVGQFEFIFNNAIKTWCRFVKLLGLTDHDKKL